MLANDNYAIKSERDRVHRKIRLIFVVGTTAVLFVLRLVDPVIAGNWIPLPTSCGAITGLPCIFCGMTRALHLLLHGDFGGTLYFNWLAFPFIALIIFLDGLFAIELAKRRVIVKWNAITPITARKLTVIGVTLYLLWVLQVNLAIFQHKHELLNPRGPLYALFVR